MSVCGVGDEVTGEVSIEGGPSTDVCVCEAEVGKVRQSASVVWSDERPNIFLASLLTI